MEIAETYLELWAICPYCDQHQAVESLSSDEESEWERDEKECRKVFKYSGSDY